jgi:hypothetical protein
MTTIRDFLQTVVNTSSDPHLVHEAEAILAAAPTEGLREALIRLVEQPEEPLDADGFCKHGLLAGVACSVWEHEPWEQARAALARHESAGSE